MRCARLIAGMIARPGGATAERRRARALPRALCIAFSGHAHAVNIANRCTNLQATDGAHPVNLEEHCACRARSAAPRSRRVAGLWLLAFWRVIVYDSSYMKSWWLSLVPVLVCAPCIAVSFGVAGVLGAGLFTAAGLFATPLGFAVILGLVLVAAFGLRRLVHRRRNCAPSVPVGGKG